MATTYPAKIDTVITLPTAVDNFTPIKSDAVNGLRDAILKIEQALGVNPGGIYGNVGARFVYLESLINSGGGGGGGSGITLGGDLSGTNTSQVVVGLFNHPLAPTLPVPHAVPVSDGTVYQIRQLSLDDILPAFAITSFVGGSTVECGATVTNPSFTASYSATPTSAQITNNDTPTPQDSPLTLVSPFTSGTVVGNFTHSVVNYSVTFTLTAVGATTKTANQFITYLARSFGGLGTSGATSATASGNNAVLAGASGTLGNEGLHSSDIGQAYGPFSPSGQKIYLLLPHTASAHTFKDQNGFTFVMNSPTTFSFTNQNGAVISMDLYESLNVLSTTFTVTVSS